MSRNQQAHFTRITFHDVLHVVLYDLQLNDPFLCLTSVLSQNTGIPIGGPMSAQMASPTLIYREVVWPLPWGLQHTLWVHNWWLCTKPMWSLVLKNCVSISGPRMRP